jgi:hypothetical protein
VPTRKQRRRQQKLRRHEYEEVWVDADGNVVEADDEAAVELQAGSNGAGRREAVGKGPQRGSRRSSGRVISPPSWSRVLKRGLFFAPVMFLLITVLPGGDRFSSNQKIILTVQYMLMLVVFMYLTERVTYRIWRKRQGGVEAQKR